MFPVRGLCVLGFSLWDQDVTQMVLGALQKQWRVADGCWLWILSCSQLCNALCKLQAAEPCLHILMGKSGTLRGATLSSSSNSKPCVSGAIPSWGSESRRALNLQPSNHPSHLHHESHSAVGGQAAGMTPCIVIQQLKSWRQGAAAGMAVADADCVIRCQATDISCDQLPRTWSVPGHCCL